MSENERRQRAAYREKRNKILTFNAVLLIIFMLLAVASSVVFARLSDVYYISYLEKSDIDYKVYLKDNDFYDEEYLGEGQAYVSTLIDRVVADFEYELAMESSSVEYEYSYKIDAQLQITDRSSNNAIFDPVYSLVPEQKLSQNSSSKLSIRRSVEIDYTEYNELAKSFINTYNLSDTYSTLTLLMQVNVLGVCDEFQSDNRQQYSVALSIPLTQKTLDINMTSSVPTSESKILACSDSTLKDIFQNLALSSGAVTLLIALIFIALVYLTRNPDIEYEIKVKKIVSSYKSYIQRILNPFDTDGYQLLYVNSFTEMLEIRDTISSPILMNENEDKTRTKFFIPTNTKLLYIYDLKADDYDELYKDKEEDAIVEVADRIPEATCVMSIESEGDSNVASNDTDDTVTDESTDYDVTSSVESANEPDGNISFEEDESFDYRSGIRYNYSFEARLALSDEQTKSFYRQIASFVASYGVKIARSWRGERIYKGRKTFAVLLFKGQRLGGALALEPAKYVEGKYRAIDMSAYKRFEKTPTLLKITSQRRVKYTIELLAQLFKEAGLENKSLGIEVGEIPYRSKKRLILEKLIKTNANHDHLIDDTPDIPAAQPELTENTAEPTLEEKIAQAIATPDVELEQIDYVDEIDEVYEETEEKPGVDVIGVVWPERAHRNKIYRYDPDGMEIHDGDIVLVPSRDNARGRDIVRKVTVAHGNHKVDPEIIQHPLKKVISIVKRRIQDMIYDK